MLDKTYNPSDIETRHYPRWEKSGVFSAKSDSSAQPYVIMMPPPNVTGSLHMGHALTFTVQDILIRYNRMCQKDALWQPGMDHAGIATQMVVERKLEADGQKRTDLGRDAFLEKVWDWKAESGGAIVNQLRRLGASPDWPRERFTMDEGLSKAVRKVFVELYKQGLIYRDKRLVNWDPKLHTAISDLEVISEEKKGKLWYFRYPLTKDPSQHIIVATTRPETMLGDTAIAVHPEDDRYKDLIGQTVTLPIVGREIPIVADDYADPEAGSGAVKITPAHDFNDFEVGRRNQLDLINIMDRDAKILSQAEIFQAHVDTDDHVQYTGDPQFEAIPQDFAGLDRFEARKKIVQTLEALELLEKVDDHLHKVPHGDRGGVPVEPWLTDQWYCDAKTLAKPAIEAVETGKTRFVPKNWENTYFEWMRNIQPWCISRQLWWGHQIPVWYGPDGAFFVAEDAEQAAEQARAHYGEDVVLVQDQDVLDTWFSSALWPFSTLGWPDDKPDIQRYYPGDVLVTGFDIIFFWVARMMMMGLHFMGDVPFKDVYIHALVRDEKGQKMSKSKGNVIDPLNVIDQYGADALRFTLCAMAAQGRDIKLSISRVEGYRNFCTKLWNASRLCEMNQVTFEPDFDPTATKLVLNRWIIGELVQTQKMVDKAIADYKFNEAAQALYQFTWATFCDWYLELTKSIFQSENQMAIAETRACMAWLLNHLLHFLHPFIPFITEELWAKLGFSGHDDHMLMAQSWPQLGESLIDLEASEELGWVTQLIGAVRTVRSEMNVPPKAKLPMLLKDATASDLTKLDHHADQIARMAGLAKMEPLEGDIPKGAVQIVLNQMMILLPIADVIDIEQEKARLSKDIQKSNAEIAKMDKKLSNQNFITKAPTEVVEDLKERYQSEESARAKIQEALSRLETL